MSGADPRMVRIGTGPPFWQINHANSAYFRLFLGYFGVISANRPPLFTYPGSSPECPRNHMTIVYMPFVQNIKMCYYEDPDNSWIVFAKIYMSFNQILKNRIFIEKRKKKILIPCRKTNNKTNKHENWFKKRKKITRLLHIHIICLVCGLWSITRKSSKIWGAGC